MCSIPGSARSLGGENGNPLRNLAWKISETEKPGGLQFMALQRVGHMTEQLNNYYRGHFKTIAHQNVTPDLAFNDFCPIFYYDFPIPEILPYPSAGIFL